MTNDSTVPHGLPMDRDAGPFEPPREVTRLRETRPVSPMVFPDGHEGWLVTGYDAVRRLMADTRFSSRQDLGILHMPYETPGMPAPTEPSPQIPACSSPWTRRTTPGCGACSPAPSPSNA